MKEANISKQFESTYKQFAGGIFRYVYFKVTDYELAKDITSEVFIKYWKILTDGKKITIQKALLYLIAQGLVIDYYRKKKNAKRVSLKNIDERLLELRDSTEDELLKKQELEQIFLKMKQLKKSFQEVLFLHYVEDFTVKEIASMQKKKENAVRVLLHRALQALKEKL